MKAGSAQSQDTELEELMSPGCSDRGRRERVRWGSGSISEDTAKATFFSLNEKERDLARLFIYHSNPSLPPNEYLKKLKLNSFRRPTRFLELTPKKMSYYRGLNAKVVKKHLE